MDPSRIESRDGYVDTHGAIIYYMTIGTGAPLVLLHGGPGSTHEYFLPYLLPLARNRQLVLVDERGCGRSQRLEDLAQYNLTEMANDIEAVCGALKLGKVDLLGHSFGGILAQAYRALAPIATGALHAGPPTYDLEIWLASALLSVTFPFLIFFAEFFKFWPLAKTE